MKKLCLLLALMLAVTAVPVLSASAAINNTYVDTLFDQSQPIEINIIMSDEAWNTMIKNASSEEYNQCDLEVNGVLYENVAIRPKGNSSLSSVTSSGSQRYSWRIKFDKYEKKRTCDGLDVLILNNGFKDPGELREALAYDMYAFLDADASLYNYAVVYVNGEYFGCYLALEGVDKSFAKRNYGEDYGELYKPDITGNANRNKIDEDFGEERDDDAGASDGASAGGSAGGQATDTAPAENGQGENAAPAENGEANAEDMAASSGGQAAAEGEDAEAAAPAAGTADEWAEGAQPAVPADNAEQADSNGDSAGGSAGDQNAEGDDGASDGASAGARSESELAMALNYVGDDLASYQSIWDASKFTSEDEDHARVVEALKHVCQGDSIADYLDVDNVLKYMAIQAFIYNTDGLTGTVTHNYYLYEQDGKLNLIPWDMNESFSASGNGSTYVNFPIDTPFTVSDLSERSFFMSLLENEEYLAQYHEYLRQLSEEYALGGGLAATLERIRGSIDTLVETDPTKFSTYADYEAAVASLQSVIQLRAQSVLGQISGEIPSTKEGQAAEPDKLLDTSGADLSGLTGGAGMGFGMMPGFN